MAFLLPFAPLITGLGIAAGGVAGIYSAVQGAKQAKKAADQQPSSPAPLPTPPTEASAEEKAKIDLQKRRRISVLSGGDTDKTRSKALVGEDQSTKKTLLGA